MQYEMPVQGAIIRYTYHGEHYVTQWTFSRDAWVTFSDRKDIDIIEIFVPGTGAKPKLIMTEPPLGSVVENQLGHYFVRIHSGWLAVTGAGVERKATPETIGAYIHEWKDMIASDRPQLKPVTLYNKYLESEY